MKRLTHVELVINAGVFLLVGTCLVPTADSIPLQDEAGYNRAMLLPRILASFGAVFILWLVVRLAVRFFRFVYGKRKHTPMA